MFHRFPVEENIRHKWIQFCKRSDSWIPEKNQILCSVHFGANDYQIENSSLLDNRNILRVLKPSAIPSLLQSSPPIALETFLKAEKETVTHSVPICSTPTAIAILQQADKSGKHVSPRCSTCIKKGLAIEELKLANNRKDMSFKQILKVNSKLSCQLRIAAEKVENYKKDMAKLKKEIDRLKRTLVTPSQDTQGIKSMLKSCLSSNQIDILTGKRNKVKWTNDELGKASKLRYISKRAYKYVATDLNYPLPSISTLQRCLIMKDGSKHDG